MPLNRTESLIAAIRGKVASRALQPGDRLPSVRRYAETMDVSASTVVEAYDRLAAEGFIYAVRGSGFYVSGNKVHAISLVGADSRQTRVVDPLWVSRQSLDAEPSMLMPGCGWLPSDWMPQKALRRGVRALASGPAAALSDYGSTRGSDLLRRILLSRFADEGLVASPEQLMLTGSGTQSIDLICRFLLQPGDTVLIDDPCYFNFRALLRAHRVNVVGVAYTPTGPDIVAFEQVVATEQPKLYITNSAIHNPTGASLSVQTAHRLLKVATANGVTVVEDDIFADFEPSPSPRLAVVDGLNEVIRIGSFSKTLSASMRCGYIAARADWIDGLVDLQVATSFGGPSPIAAETVAGILAGGSYRKHMQALRLRLAQSRASAAESLISLGIEPWTMPRGGFYLWCRLKEGQDASKIAQDCIRHDVMLAPGNVFSVSHAATNFMRFNVVHCIDQRVFDVLAEALLKAERSEGS